MLDGPTQHPPMTWHERPCGMCGGKARILAPVGASDLDVDAEFSSAARAYGRYDDHEFVACYRCAKAARAMEPLFITGDDGTKYLLSAQSAQDARAWLEAFDDPAEVTDAGWMHNVGWDRDGYERKRDFEDATGCSSWWEGCLPPADGQQTKGRRKAWVVTYA